MIRPRCSRELSPAGGSARFLALALFAAGVLVALLLFKPGGGSKSVVTESAPDPAPRLSPDPKPLPEPTRRELDVPTAPPAETAQQERPAVRPPVGTAQARDLALEERMQRLRGLMPGQESGERLALAREILGEDAPGPLASRALNVLAELDPESAAEECRRLLADLDGEPYLVSIVPQVIRSLEKEGPYLSDEDLRAALETERAEVQLAAVRALEARGDTTVTGALVLRAQERLESDDPLEQMQAISLLTRMPGPEARPVVLGLLEHEKEEIRLRALQGLGMSFQDEDLEEVLPRMLDDPSERVRDIAQRMLRRQEMRSNGGR